MIRKTVIFILMLGACVVLAQTTAPTSQPAPAKAQAPAKPQATTPAETELRAVQAFNRGEYAIALPLLRKTVEAYKTQPEKIGPLEEMIRVSQKALASANLQQNIVADPNASPEPAISADRRTPHPTPEAGKVLEMSIKELGNFEYDLDQGGNIPADVQKLSGSMVRVSGYMIPIDQAERITRFALVPSLFACCFGQPPQLQHTIVVDCPDGKAVSYFPDEIVVEGTLNVQEKKDDDIIVSIFEMKTSSVKPAAK